MKKRIVILSITLLIVLIVAGYSFAYLRTQSESGNQTVTLSNFGVILLNDLAQNVTLTNTYPMSDFEGVTNESATFSIKNTGAVTANYNVSLIDGQVASTMKNEDVRYRLKKTTGGVTETLDIKNLDVTGLIDSGTIEADQIISYELVLWVDYDASPVNQSFSKIVIVDGMQADNLDKSGANFPELLDNMIPVYYVETSNTEGVWKKADSTNKNSTYKWFDYNNQMWANAVTVKESGTQTRDYYLNAAKGTTIDMDDITTMWVWIPRYKYVIFNGNDETAEEQMINVTFEHAKESTGTVTCVDNILGSINSDTSQTCTDTTNNGIVNGKSTYTHPAFTFGDEELTGVWMAKFEMSTDDVTCNTTPNAANCDKNGLNILIKPNQESLRYECIANFFTNIRFMENYENIHGFANSELATSINWTSELTSSYTGEFTTDTNNFDIHMIKNMEWGAVAYLSQSKYGKQGNNLYSGDYKKIFVGTFDNHIYTTGYSSGASSSGTYLYNDLTSEGSGYGYNGAGSSSTGNIYGVYDLAGAAIEYTMANSVNTSVAFNTSQSGWLSSTGPVEKYYDKYSYNSTSGSTKRGRLGDATKEITVSTSNLWDGGYISFPCGTTFSWLSRGYKNVGVFYMMNDNGSAVTRGSRPILAISRDMPWLNN